MLRRGLLFLVLSWSAGCSLLTSLDGLSTGGADAGSAPVADAETGADDAAPPAETGTDAGSVTDASTEAGTDAAPPPNIHANGSFEAKVDPWGGYQGTVVLDPTAHSGAKSLRVCGNDGVDYFTADDNSAHPNPTVGATYRAEAWVRTAPGAVTPPNISVFLRTVNLSDGFTVIELGQTDGAPLTSTWQKVSVTLKVTKPAQRLGVFVGADWIAGACFLLDDVVLQRLD